VTCISEKKVNIILKKLNITLNLRYIFFKWDTYFGIEPTLYNKEKKYYYHGRDVDLILGFLLSKENRKMKKDKERRCEMIFIKKKIFEWLIEKYSMWV